MVTHREEWIVPAGADDHDMQGPAEYLRRVVRVFPDYADTVLWFVNGPVDYADSCITPELADAMRWWEESLYQALDDFDVSSSEFAAADNREGLRLARALSDELGDAFEVEVNVTDDERGRHLVRMRGTLPGTNSRAVERFRKWVADAEAHDAELREMRAQGYTFGSFVPLSGIDWTDESPTYPGN